MEKQTSKLEIEIASETANDLQTLFEEQGWDRQEALRSLVGAGLMAMRLKTFDENPDKVLSAKARARWLEVERDLAVLRFRLFELEQANSRWEMSTGAIKTQNIAFDELLRAKDRELAELKNTYRGTKKGNRAPDPVNRGLLGIHGCRLLACPAPQLARLLMHEISEPGENWRRYQDA